MFIPGFTFRFLKCMTLFPLTRSLLSPTHPAFFFLFLTTTGVHPSSTSSITYISCPPSPSCLQQPQFHIRPSGTITFLCPPVHCHLIPVIYLRPIGKKLGCVLQLGVFISNDWSWSWWNWVNALHLLLLPLLLFPSFLYFPFLVTFGALQNKLTKKRIKALWQTTVWPNWSTVLHIETDDEGVLPWKDGRTFSPKLPQRLGTHGPL